MDATKFRSTIVLEFTLQYRHHGMISFCWLYSLVTFPCVLERQGYETEAVCIPPLRPLTLTQVKGIHVSSEAHMLFPILSAGIVIQDGKIRIRGPGYGIRD